MNEIGYILNINSLLTIFDRHIVKSIMKLVLLFLCIGIYYCTLVQYKSGTIIKQIATINSGSTTLHLVIQIPQIVDQPEYEYYRPCNYGLSLQTDLAHVGVPLSDWPGVMERFKKLCKMFTKIKKLNLQLRTAYVDKIENAREAEKLLSKNSSRKKRSIFSAIRHVFNIGDYNEQLRLQNLVETLQTDQISTQGELVGLKFVIAHQAEKIKVLQQSAHQVVQVMDSIVAFSNNLSKVINIDHTLKHYHDNMIFDMVTAGIFTNQLLQEYSGIVNDQIQAFALLTRHYLPPSMISPQDLKVILEKLVIQLTSRYQFLSLQYEHIQMYYAMNNIDLVVENNHYYIQIPVLLKMFEQQFQLYELQPFYLPLPNQNDKLMKVIHQPFVAVNQQAGTFLTLKHNWRKQLNCVGKHTVFCNGVITEHYTNAGNNCEFAIVSNDTNGIKNYCEFAIVRNEAVSPKIHNIGDNRILLENPHGARVYQKCMDSTKKTFITQELLVEIEVPCFCVLFTETFTTTLITSDVCITTPEVKMYNAMDNILFLNMLLNDTVRDNITITMIPQLILPDLIQDFDIDDDSNLLNLKDVLNAHRSKYYHTARSQLNRHENMMESYPIVRIGAIIAPAVAVVVIGVIIYVSVRTKKLGQLISLLSLSKTIEAAPISSTTENADYYDFFTNICTVILLVLWALYLFLRYYKFFCRVRRTITLPFNECVSASNPPSWKLVLYLSSFNTYCYLYIDQILRYPDQVITSFINTELSLTFHSNICNTYVSLNNPDITLITKGESFLLPTAIAIPCILKHTVQSILASDCKVQLMIGSGSHFQVLPISSISTRLPSPVNEEETEL